MDNANILYERRNSDGTSDYVVDLGTILYNEKILTISNLLIPIRGQSFFTLPEDKGRFAAVNVYYQVETGSFVFDLIQKSDSFLQNVTADALSNHLPIAQFILKESLGSFDVVVVSPYSKMSTFSITVDADQGDRGLQGPVGDTGLRGYIGAQGFTGYVGEPGLTGEQGITGVGVIGATGIQGATGYYPDTDLLFYGKFKAGDITLTDYSVYERDFGWGASGAGFTGTCYTGIGLGYTASIFFPEDPGSFTVENGVVDNCHSIVWPGGFSSYKNETYIGFTGTIQTWFRIDHTPIVDFSYEIDIDNPLLCRFYDASLLYPTQWEWDLGVGSTFLYNKNINYVFVSHGSYVVTLRARNKAGWSERSKVVII